MSGKCLAAECKSNSGLGYCRREGSCKYEAHKPDPNESPSSPRTIGSLPASTGHISVEGTGTQLAPFSARTEPLLSDKPGGVCTIPGGCPTSMADCQYCDYYKR